MRFRSHKNGKAYPIGGGFTKGRDAKLEALIQKTRIGVKKAIGYPHTIIFDWNGTIDARNTGKGIPIDVLVYLQRLGKKIIVFTSSTNSDRKAYMRNTLDKYGIPYTENEDILKYGDMYVADKRSDERRAGRYGINFSYTGDFDLMKLLERGATKAPPANGTQ